MTMLKPLGIEKGKPFNPTTEQKKILTEAALVGEAMAKANDFSKRLEDAHYMDGSHWEFATVAPPDQRREHYDALDGRAAWFYEAVTNDPAMHGQKTGKGQVYLAAYKDKDGDWLDGGTNYVLHVPADAPAETFWSVTAYEVSTRTLVNNQQEIADRSSRMDLADEPGRLGRHLLRSRQARGRQGEELDPHRGGARLVPLFPALFAQAGVPGSFLGAAGYREGAVSSRRLGAR